MQIAIRVEIHTHTYGTALGQLDAHRKMTHSLLLILTKNNNNSLMHRHH